MGFLASRSFITQLVSLVACAALCTAGCASGNRTLKGGPETWATSISVGDQLSVFTHSGREKGVSVTKVDESGIYDGKAFIPYSDIQSIRVLPGESGIWGNTAILVVITVAVVAVLASLVENEIDEGFIQDAR